MTSRVVASSIGSVLRPTFNASAYVSASCCSWSVLSDVIFAMSVRHRPDLLRAVLALNGHLVAASWQFDRRVLLVLERRRLVEIEPRHEPRAATDVLHAEQLRTLRERVRVAGDFAVR